MTVLLLDNFIEKRFSEMFNNYLRSDIDIYDAPGGFFPEDLDKYSHVLISGSEASIVDDHEWVDKEMELVRKLLEKRIPTLGLCYGHQLIARALLGKEAVRHSKTPEFGWFEVELLGEDELFFDLGGKFEIYMVHFDEVVETGELLDPLAKSENCAIQAFRVIDAPMWGVQFHPEIEKESAEDFLVELANKFPELGLEPVEITKLASETDVPERILRNFYDVVRD